MNSIKEVIHNPSVSAFTGSLATRANILRQIEARWGKEEGKNYDPFTNCLTFAKWSSLSHRVKPGEKALRSITYVEVKDEKGAVIKKIPRTVYLFYYLQVTSPRFIQT